MQKFDFSYDEQNNDLFLFSPLSKSKASVEFGDLILDFNGRKELVGLQLMHATKFLKKAALAQASEVHINEILRSLKRCEVQVNYHNRLMFIKLFLCGEKEELTQVFSIPSLTETSPAIA